MAKPEVPQEYGKSEAGRLFLTRLWQSHPLNAEVRVMHPCTAPHAQTNMDGKHVEAGQPLFENQCAVRLGVALKQAGVVLHNSVRIETCGAHPKEEMHTIRANELARALEVTKMPGMRPVRKMTDPKQINEFFSHIPTKPGIIYIKGYWQRPGETGMQGDHIDVWNGYRTAVKPLAQSFVNVGVVSNYAQAQEVWFWEQE